MRNRGIFAAGLLTTLAGLSSPAFALPPVEQRSATSEESQVLDPVDYGPRGAGNIYGGAPSRTPYSQTVQPSAPGASKPVSGQWELTNQIQQLQEEVQSLRGLLEQQTFEIEQIKKQQRDRYLDIDSRLSRLQSAPPAQASEPAAESAAASAGAEAPVVAPAKGGGAVAGDEKQAYDAAQAKMRAKDYDGAVKQFEAVLAQYPKGAFSPQCHFWLGDLYMRKTPPQFDVAQAHLQTLLKENPTHDKAPAALLKLGKLHAEKGDKAKARAIYERLVAAFPQSTAAEQARALMR